MASAQSGMLVPTSTGRQDATVLCLREMTIDASIARGYARVNVRQIFENHTDQIQEGTYRFALAPGAAIGDFAVWDGLVRIPGVILEKRRARAIYDALNSQRVDPGLLQQGEEEDAATGWPVKNQLCGKIGADVYTLSDPAEDGFLPVRAARDGEKHMDSGDA